MAEVTITISWLVLTAGGLLFVAGAIGLARFPDIYCRLHAVTKADTLGMGLLVLGLAVREPDWSAVAVMVIVWFLVAASSAITCHLLARYEQQDEAPEDQP